MKIIYNKKAVEDIQKMEHYIIEQFDNIGAAKKLVKNIVDTISLLSISPSMGAKLKDKFDIDTEIRYLVVSRQIVFYKIENNIVEIIRVLDSRQDYLSILF